MPTPELKLNPYLEAIAQDLRDALSRQGLNTTGRASSSIRIRNQRNIIASGYISTLFQGVGRRPGKRPPIQAIYEWVVNKGIQFTRPGGAPMTFSQMAFSIANKIRDRGTRIYRDRRRGIQMDKIIEKNNNIYMPRIARDLKNTYVDAFNSTIIT